MQLDLRSAALGGILALGFGVLAAAQLPTFSAQQAGGSYGFFNPGRELWRWTPGDQIANGPYAVPAGKELIVCGVGVLPLPNSAGGFNTASPRCFLTVDGEGLLAANPGSYGSTGEAAVSYFPGLLVEEGQVLEFGPYWSNNQINPSAFVYGYLRTAQ